MKAFLLTALTGIMALNAAAEVTIVLNNNYFGCVRSPVYGPEPGDPTISRTGNTASGLPAGTMTYRGALLTGTGYSAQLFCASGAVIDETALIAVGPPTVFRTSPLGGYLVSTNVVVPFLSPGMRASFQIRVWENMNGRYDSWPAAEAAWQMGLIAIGKSSLLVVISDPLSPTYLCGLLSFNLYSLARAPAITLQPENQAVSVGQNGACKYDIGARAERLEVTTNISNRRFWN